MHVGRPGFITTPGIISGLLTILIVVAVSLARGGALFSPGPLNAKAGAQLGGITSHADLSSKCSACHTAFWQRATLADRCVVCHADITTQQQEPASIHGMVYKGDPGISCRKCHPDHRGTEAPLTDMQNVYFPHDLTGYSFLAHQKQTDGSTFICNDCHGNDFAKFDQSVCVICHQKIKLEFMQVHRQTYGEDCLACHDGIDTYGRNFNHENVIFQLTGKHAQVACDKCHQDARSLADLRGLATDCVSCHKKDNPHSVRLGSNCESCHTSTGWTPATFDHNLAVFKLEGKHIDVACESCHGNKVFRGTPIDCISCHKKDDKHNGQFGLTCNLCHNAAGWLPATFDHNIFQFMLIGKHVNVACINCHVNNAFKGTPTLCVDCHGSINPHSERLGSDCGKCHTTGGWLPATFDHNLAAFSLTGKHVQVPCADCHINNLYRGTPASCYACHQKDDRHNGQFGTDCSLCHNTSGWLPAYFDHSGFPLTNGHAGLSCNSCHASGRYVGLSNACASCHNTPASHAGLFGSDCSQCHNTSNWNFNHPNVCDGSCVNHEGASCSDCHTSNYSSATCTKCHDGGGDD